MKKIIIFLVIGLVLGAGLAGGGVYFMVQNGAIKPPEEVIEPAFDLKDGQRLTLEKVQIPLVQTGSKAAFLQADFTIIFKSAEALALAESMIPDIKDAIYGVFETKTADELRAAGAREAMKEPVLEAIKGLYNIQFIVDEKDDIYIIEVNPRSSRTVPFLSKATGYALADIATRTILGKSLKEQGITNTYPKEKKRWYVKAPAFSFSKLKGMDSYLSPEMKSTGEAIGYDNSLSRAMYKA